MLISSSGHIKLTDFGLSWARIGIAGTTSSGLKTTASSADMSTAARESAPSGSGMLLSSPTNPRGSGGAPPSASALPIDHTSAVAPDAAVPAHETADTAHAPAGSFATAQKPPSTRDGLTAGAAASASNSAGAPAGAPADASPRFSRCFSIVGSPHYVAPEVLRATGHSTPVDWWALGVIAFELLTGLLPFGADGSVRGVQERVLSGCVQWPTGSTAQHLSPTARDLISRLLVLSAKERLGTRGALEVRGHDFFRAVSWADLLRHNSFYIPLPTSRAQRTANALPATAESKPLLRRSLVEKSSLVAGARTARRRASHDGSTPSCPHGDGPPSAQSGEGTPAAMAAGGAPPSLWQADCDSGAHLASASFGGGEGGVSGGGHRRQPSFGCCGSFGGNNNSFGGNHSFDDAGLPSMGSNPQASLLLAGSHLSAYMEGEAHGSGGVGAEAARGNGQATAAPACTELASPTGTQLPNFDYTNVSNLMRINEEAEQNAGSISNHQACTVCKWHLTQLSNAWITPADFDERAAGPFVEVPLHTAAVEGGLELRFRENLVRITQHGLPPAATTVRGCPPPHLEEWPAAAAGPNDDGARGSLGSPSGSTSSAPLRPVASARRGHPQAEYPPGSEWIEIWFKNECRLVHGLTLRGSYSYGRWWKGLAARYVRPGDVDASPFESLDESAELYSYAELEHEAAGPTLTVGLWRLRPLPARLLADRDKLRVQLCLAKAKAFGIKRTVHRISFAYADLVGRRTTLTWVQD